MALDRMTMELLGGSDREKCDERQLMPLDDLARCSIDMQRFADFMYALIQRFGSKRLLS